MQEATRIKTPPISTPSSPVLQPRGFFFDYAHPKDDSKSGSEHHSQCSNGSSSNKGKAKDTDSSPGAKEWWEADTKHAYAGNKSTERAKIHKKPRLFAGPSAFDLNLPEHLPSSPLCPKNPLHKGGGKGICAYHGRRRSVGLKVLRRATTESSVETLKS
jgi:parafibromin